MRIALLCLFTACSGIGSGIGDGTSGSDCREMSDCAQGLSCGGPDEGPVCGIAPREECSTDAACFGGMRCNAIYDACTRDYVGSECSPACTGDAQCGTGFRCQTGACVAQLCTEGYTCPGYQVCDPGRITVVTPMYDRSHGCYDVACTTDAQCGGRFCVNSICQDSLGSCEKPVAVP